MTTSKIKTNKALGIIILAAGVSWIIEFSWLFYAYNYTDILWYYMFPQWVLIFNCTLGLIGVLIGYRLFAGKIAAKTAYFLQLLLLLWSIYQLSSFYIERERLTPFRDGGQPH
jgi:hypothetical protein